MLSRSVGTGEGSGCIGGSVARATDTDARRDRARARFMLLSADLQITIRYAHSTGTRVFREETAIHAFAWKFRGISRVYEKPRSTDGFEFRPRVLRLLGPTKGAGKPTHYNDHGDAEADRGSIRHSASTHGTIRGAWRQAKLWRASGRTDDLTQR